MLREIALQPCQSLIQHANLMLSIQVQIHRTHPLHASPGLRRPLIIEICAGNATLSRCFQDAGFDSLSIDHAKKRHVPLAKICKVDLTKSHGWEFMRHILSHYPVSHYPLRRMSTKSCVAPVCGPSQPQWVLITLLIWSKRESMLQMPLMSVFRPFCCAPRGYAYPGPSRTPQAVCFGAFLVSNRCLTLHHLIAMMSAHGVQLDWRVALSSAL